MVTLDEPSECSVFVSIDETLCVGSGLCEQLEPTAVELGDDGLARPVPGVALSPERAETICRNCPTQAISVAGVCPNRTAVPETNL